MLPALGQPPATYRNPLAVSIGAPYVLHEPGGPYYLYGTGSDGATAFPTFKSGDLVNWTPVGQTYARDPGRSWCTGSFWAPEVYRVNGKCYMFYSAQWKNNPGNEKENFRIGVAVADNPAGPFRDVRNEPVFDPGYPAIDADVLFDSDGRAYLYYSRCCYKHPVESELADWARKQGLYTEIEESWIYGVELTPDFSGIIGQPVVLLRPPVTMANPKDAWEDLSVTTHEINRRWTEGPCSFKRGSKYFLMYSANHVMGDNYSIGYATSNLPLGRFKKAANNPVVRKNTDRRGDVVGTGHDSVAVSPDGSEMFCVYHARLKGQNSAEQRVLFLDRMEIRKDGTLVVHGPDTTLSQPYPSARKR